MSALTALLLALGTGDVPVLPHGAEVADRSEAALWAHSDHALYVRPHEGGEWRELLSQEPWIFAAFATGSGGVLLFGEDVVRVSPEGEREVVPELRGLEGRGLIRTPAAWFAHGWSGTPPWGEEGVPGAHTVMVGEGMEATLLASLDRGETWTVVDRWAGGAIDDVCVTPGGELIVLRVGGGIRRGPLRIEDGAVSAELETLLDPEDAQETKPYGHYGGRVLFLTEELGLVTTEFFGGAGGSAFYRTSDGGRSWEKRPSLFELHGEGRWNYDAWVRGFRGLADGGWLAVTQKGVQRWNGEAFVAHGPQWRYHVDRTLVDARGDLLVTLENAQVWSLDAGGEWTPVAIVRGQELESPWKEER